jgi:hypothetical protein
MWRFLPPLRRAEGELPVAIRHLDDSSALPWIECPGRIHRQDRDVCATRADQGTHGLYMRILDRE